MLSNKKGQHAIAFEALAPGLRLFSTFPLRGNGLRCLVGPQIILEAVSMMGEACVRTRQISHKDSLSRRYLGSRFSRMRVSQIVARARHPVTLCENKKAKALLGS